MSEPSFTDLCLSIVNALFLNVALFAVANRWKCLYVCAFKPAEYKLYLCQSDIDDLVIKHELFSVSEGTPKAHSTANIKQTVHFFTTKKLFEKTLQYHLRFLTLSKKVI